MRREPRRAATAPLPPNSAFARSYRYHLRELVAHRKDWDEATAVSELRRDGLGMLKVLLAASTAAGDRDYLLQVLRHIEKVTGLEGPGVAVNLEFRGGSDALPDLSRLSDAALAELTQAPSPAITDGRNGIPDKPDG